MSSKLRILAKVGRCFGAGETFVGAGSIGAIAGLPPARIVVLASGSIAANPAHTDKLDRALARQSYKIIPMPSGEPCLENLQEVMLRVSDYRPDWIIAVGGGSVLDAAKIIWIFYEHPDIELDILSRPFAIPPLRGQARFIAVPTTAGTGSEASSAAVFQSKSGERKSFAVTHDLLPDIAILDPQFMDGLPRKIAISSAFDALSHAVEGYISPYANEMTRQLAQQSCHKILSIMESGMEINEEKTSEALLVAASFAGIVQNIAIPGIGHAISHEFSSLGINHGTMCGAMLPIAMEFNSSSKNIAEAYDQLAQDIGLGSHSALIEKIDALLTRHAVQEDIPIDDISKRTTLEGYTSSVLSDPCAIANPIRLDPEHIMKVSEHLVSKLRGAVS